MNFNDDSEILSRLGILESREESPKKGESKKSEKERFVDVQIDRDDDESGSDDEELFHHKNTLLSPTIRTTRTRPPRIKQSYACRYILTLLTFFVTGLASHCGLQHLSNHGNDETNLFMFINTAGFLLSILLGSSVYTRINVLLIIFLSLIGILCSLIFTYTLLIAIRGFSVGAIIYGGLSTWICYWRAHPKRAVLFFLLLSIGSSIAMANLGSRHEILSPLTRLVKREAVDIAPVVSADPLAEGTGDNATEVKPKKPDFAQGTATIETKTKENEEMRNKAKEMAANTTAAAPSNTSSTAMPPTTNSSTTTTTLAPTTTTTSTTTSTMRTVPTTPAESAASTPAENANSKLSDYLARDNATQAFTIAAISIVVLLYAFSFCICCIPISPAVDQRLFASLMSSEKNISSGCRLRIAALQCMLGFMEGLTLVILSKEWYSDKSYDQSLSPQLCTDFLVGLLRLAAMFLLNIFVSLGFCWFAIVTGVATSMIYLFSPNFIFATIFCVVVASLPLLLFLIIEDGLSPRPQQSLSYFLLPNAIGRFLWTAALYFAIVPIESATAFLPLCYLVLLIFFFLFNRSFKKAVRLKEILEYSSSIPDARGTYISLLQRDVDEDDDIQTDSELDLSMEEIS